MMRTRTDFPPAGPLVTLLLVLTGTLACAESPPRSGGMAPAVEALPPRDEFTGTVAAVTNVSRYTYVQVNTDGQTVWAAAPTFDVRVGETVLVPPSIPMKSFHSPALERTFDELCFVTRIVVVGREEDRLPQPLPPGHPEVPSMTFGHGPHGAAADPSAMDFTGIEKPEGGKTVAEVYAQREQLAGERVKVRGKVVKFTAAVMDKNWIHIRDGSGDDPDRRDLTLTTDATVAIGDVITAEGVLTLDRDFGHGYEYEVLMESATVD